MFENIKIIKSKNRKRTVSARIENGCLVISAPQNISEKRLAEIIENLKKKIQKKSFRNDVDLLERAEVLNKKYFAGKLQIPAIKYSSNQLRKFGSCNLFDGSILISERLKNTPKWVLDYVILHELAHLVVPNHSKEFKQIISKYELHQKAEGFLLGMGFREE